ncbi:hypothetical protein ACFLX7_01295 [Chloroflexota bacterium]
MKQVSANEDGTVGHQGNIIDLLPEYIDWADQLFACGPINLYNVTHKNEGGDAERQPTQVSLEIRMGCGLGVCYSCTVMTKKRTKTGL